MNRVTPMGIKGLAKPGSAENEPVNISSDGAAGPKADGTTGPKTGLYGRDPWGDQKITAAEGKLINTGKCNAPSCDKKRAISARGYIMSTCGVRDCHQKWTDAGKPYETQTPCRLCGSKAHNTMACEHLTQDKIDKLTASNKYRHMHRWWSGAANVMAARKLIFGDIKPQYMQSGSGVYKYAHGKANIGPIQRPVYFDLGGEYDLLDDLHYDEIIKCIEDGDVRGAEVITPEQLGHSARGVPVDLACSTSTSGSSIAWVKRWIRIIVEVTTKAGRKFILTQANIGFVRRSTPLLILGKKTCTLCGYRTIKQQDSDRRDEDETKRRRATDGSKKTTTASMSATATDKKVSTTSTRKTTERTDTLQIQVMHEDGKMMLGGQYLQLAASDVPLQTMSHCISDCEEEFADQASGDKGHHQHDGNKYNHRGNGSNKSHWSWINNTSHWSWTDNSHARRTERQTDAGARSQNMQQLLLSKTLAAEGKDDQGDNDADACCDQVAEEEDDDVHPEARRALAKSAFHRVKIETCVQDENNVSSHSRESEGVSKMDQVEFKMSDQSEIMTDDETDKNVIEVDVLEGNVPAQYMTIAASELELEQVDKQGNRVTRAGDLITDGYIYVGNKGHDNMATCSYIITDRLEGSYITTAALRRSGLHPEHCDPDEMDEMSFENKKQWEQLCEQPDLLGWIEGEESPHSTLMSGCKIEIYETLVLSPFKDAAKLRNREYTVIPSNELKVIMGYEMTAEVDSALESDESPLQEDDKKVLKKDLEDSLLQDLVDSIKSKNELSESTKNKVADMLKNKYAKAWRTKYELTEPAKFPTMKIRLNPGAEPKKIRRRYNGLRTKNHF